jgi:thiamine biosynthesis lipoprotein
MSIYRPDSELSAVNREAYERPVKVSPELFEVMRESIRISRLTDGAFDVTVGPMMDLWKQAGENGEKPTREQIDRARERVGYDKLILDEANRTIRFAVKGMKIDLGGIAKGKGIDLAVEAMQECGAIGGMVDVGGDIRCFGREPTAGRRWKVGLQDPDRVDHLLLTLSLSEKAVTTSGDYHRFVVIEGEKYSHIVNPATSETVKDVSSATIIADTATEADALATAVSVMGHEKGLALVETLEGVETILIPADGEKIVVSSGAGEYIIENIDRRVDLVQPVQDSESQDQVQEQP